MSLLRIGILDGLHRLTWQKACLKKLTFNLLYTEAIMKLNELIDELSSIRQRRAELSSEDKQLSQDAAKLEASIMSELTTVGITKAEADSGNSVTMKQGSYPAITDWPTFYKHVQETNGFDLLHKRLSNVAFRDRWEAGEVIPGT